MIDGYYAIDYQVHSYRSHDGKASILEQCERAVELGLDELGFSEHKDFNPEDPVVGHFDYNRYSDEIAQAKELYAGKLIIRMGVELDYQQWFQDMIADYLTDHAFDFIISSVHYADGATVMTPEYIRGRDVQECYQSYFEEVLASVRQGCMKILGHMEYANRRGVPAFGPYEASPYREITTEIYDLMIRKGIALEINTAGLRQGAGITYPCEQQVALYAERGGKLLSIGSDAHRPEDLADCYTVAAEMALRNGFTHITTWKNGAPRQVPLKI